MNDQALFVEGLSAYYHRYAALWDISLQIPRAQLVGIIGPNGAGKSTLVKALLGIEKPVTGRALFFGKSYSKMQKHIAYVPQRSSIDWQFPITAKEVVLMGAYRQMGFLKWPNAKQKQQANAMLERLGMLDLSHKQIDQLSGGEQQRLFIARALMQQADIFFFDEPFNGVDLTTQTFLIDLFKQMVKEGKTVFVVHHDLAKVEEYFSWIILLNTQLVASGKTSEVFNMDTLAKAYGNTQALLEKALKLSKEKREGLRL